MMIQNWTKDMGEFLITCIGKSLALPFCNSDIIFEISSSVHSYIKIDFAFCFGIKSVNFGSGSILVLPSTSSFIFEAMDTKYWLNLFAMTLLSVMRTPSILN